jgi:hypothetical protein
VSNAFEKSRKLHFPSSIALVILSTKSSTVSTPDKLEKYA